MCIYSYSWRLCLNKMKDYAILTDSFCCPVSNGWIWHSFFNKELFTNRVSLHVKFGSSASLKMWHFMRNRKWALLKWFSVYRLNKSYFNQAHLVFVFLLFVVVHSASLIITQIKHSSLVMQLMPWFPSMHKEWTVLVSLFKGKFLWTYFILFMNNKQKENRAVSYISCWIVSASCEPHHAKMCLD